MIELKEIKRDSGTITCKAYIEDCKESIPLSFDILTSMLKDVSLPQGYDWCKSHISHAKDYLIEIASKEMLPDNHTIMWYWRFFKKDGDIMKNKKIESSAEFQAYVERISAAPCPRKISAEEMRNLKKKKNKFQNRP